jgi:hypothetical protein
MSFGLFYNNFWLTILLKLRGILLLFFPIANINLSGKVLKENLGNFKKRLDLT